MLGQQEGGANYSFYSNEIPFQPYGVKIDKIHSQWRGDYTVLFRNKEYIQWLFPLFDTTGVNKAAVLLTKDEAQRMRDDEEIGHRVAVSYEIMLDYFGMKLDWTTGQVSRADHWQERYRLFPRSSGNFMKISRILASLDNLGLWRWKLEWINFLEEEIFQGDQPLQSCAKTFERFWLPLRQNKNLAPDEIEDNAWYRKQYLVVPNLLPQSLIDELKLQHMDEGITQTLSTVCSRGVPSTLQQWVAAGIPIGFPDNGVWSAVEFSLQDLPAKLDASMSQYAQLDQRIETLKKELSALTAQKAQWSQLVEPMRHLQANSASLMNAAKELGQAEMKMSNLAMKQFAAHALNVSEEPDDGSTPPAELDSSAWQAVLCAAGLSIPTMQKLDDFNILYQDTDLDHLSVTERLDVKYLQDMVRHKSVPYVHPFHERYDVNAGRHPCDDLPYITEHSCVICDCGSPAQLINLLKERQPDSLLTKLDWTTHAINGPRFIMMNAKELKSLFPLSPGALRGLVDAIWTLKKEHDQILLD